VQGEIRAAVLTDYPERLVMLKTFYLGDDYVPYTVERARRHKQFVLIKFAGVDSRDDADELRTLVISVTMQDAIPLDNDEYYDFQLEGLAVVTDTGETLGELVEVFTAPGANDVFVVHGPRGEMLLPVIEDVVVALDLDAGQVVVHPLPGLLD
jgi:16S rRNA processing protein RimM